LLGLHGWDLKRGGVDELGGAIEKIRHTLCLECQELGGLALLWSPYSYRAFNAEPYFWHRYGYGSGFLQFISQAGRQKRLLQVFGGVVKEKVQPDDRIMERVAMWAIDTKDMRTVGPFLEISDMVLGEL
jgi:hypothetical protein